MLVAELQTVIGTGLPCSAEELRIRMEPEAIVWIELFLQRRDRFCHGFCSKDDRRHSRRTHVIWLRVRAAEVDCQAVHVACLVNDLRGEIGN